MAFRLLLASEGRAFGKAAVDLAGELASGAEQGYVGVLCVARVWGSAFGFPNPWLMPSRRELEEQRQNAALAVETLRRRGVPAEGRVIGTRDAARRIVREAEQGGYDAIVMAADPARPRMIGELFWSQEPNRVQRRAKVPVHLVISRQATAR